MKPQTNRAQTGEAQRAQEMTRQFGEWSSGAVMTTNSSRGQWLIGPGMVLLSCDHGCDNDGHDGVALILLSSSRFHSFVG